MLMTRSFPANLKMLLDHYRQIVRRRPVIEAVEVQVSPLGVGYVNVSGYHTEGCGVPVRVVQHRVGRMVFVDIYREWDADDICSAMTVPYEATIRLEGLFTPGAYTMDVNGTVVDFRL